MRVLGHGRSLIVDEHYRSHRIQDEGVHSEIGTMYGVSPPRVVACRMYLTVKLRPAKGACANDSAPSPVSASSPLSPYPSSPPGGQESKRCVLILICVLHRVTDSA